MKNFFKILAVLVFIVVAYLIVLQLYPKNAGRFPFLVLLFAGDYYLWRSIKNWIKRRRKFYRYFYGLLYWLPLLLIIVTSLASLSYPPENWNPWIRIYLFGFIFIAFSAKVLPIFFLLIADILRGFQFTYHKTKQLKQENQANGQDQKITRSQFLNKAGLISGGIVFAGLFTGMIKWVYDFKIHRHSLKLDRLPQSFNGLRVVQISDLHLGSWASKASLQEAVNRINDLKPDLIFFTGDLVNYKTNEAFPFKRILGGLKANLGIYVTLGNHDYGDYTRWPSKEAKQRNMKELYDFYSSLNWKLLNNQNEVINSGDGSIAVIGVENWGDFSRFPRYGDLRKAIRGAENADVKLLLSHDPSHWDKIVSREYPDIDLTFAGHTHGFQFGIEIKNVKWSPAQYVYKRWAGLYENPFVTSRKQYLYVNRGLGTIGYPGRVGILPEVTLFELRT